MEFNIVNSTVTARLTNSSGMEFTGNFPNKFDIHGFENMDVNLILQQKILDSDYAWWISANELNLQFTLENDDKKTFYVLTLNESFEEISLDEVPYNLKIFFKSLQRQITNLQTQIDNLQTQIDNLMQNKELE